ncbi:Fe-S protein assembly co-chaperone HscB [Undibacterium cyanobacteriorum]|uniref:Co-chaperone protein HscB homolog n=1 Tax=Undibacterium cyanobacteriorum TaxID=3073561 RepID=A0ABY9REV4_9BURK|nr:Fe-S protein assembly co-chaperone HscB [Undibacterium sp. 20NA77.5]WMW79185.1 Fe-S protein assembly co-chaperone HscB [Undibacterium sp. 20NA77.5]
MQNYFELFQLPVRYELDRDALDLAYREIQSRVHPDKFVQASDAEKRVAMQWATQANQAYQTLKDPLKRATYLCQLHGVELQTESNTAMPAAFLMQQMEWREAFDDARQSQDQNALYALEREVQAALKQELSATAEALAQDQYAQAAQQIRASLFLEKFLNDIAALDD